MEKKKQIREYKCEHPDFPRWERWEDDSDKRNPYVYFTIVLAIVCLLLISYYDYQEYQQKKHNIDGVIIPKEDLCLFYNQIGLNKPMQLCDLENKICSRSISFMENPCE